MSAAHHPNLTQKWAPTERAKAYREVRFRTRRKRERDLRLLARLVARHDPRTRWAQVLDAPCGTGRLQPFLSQRASTVVSLDVSSAMLAEHPGRDRLVGSAMALPFPDSAFDAVVCCRLFHHLHAHEDRAGLLRELLRVARGPVYLSFWDAASWHAWRRKRGWRRVTNEDGRIAIPRSELERLVREQNARVFGYAHSLRGISQQAWVALGSEATA